MASKDFTIRFWKSIRSHNLFKPLSLKGFEPLNIGLRFQYCDHSDISPLFATCYWTWPRPLPAIIWRPYRYCNWSLDLGTSSPTPWGCPILPAMWQVCSDMLCCVVLGWVVCWWYPTVFRSDKWLGLTCWTTRSKSLSVHSGWISCSETLME